MTGNSVNSDIFGDYATIKYNSAGQEQWVARYDGTGHEVDNGMAITVDISGNVYVTGDSLGLTTGSDYVTIKYNSEGQTQWVALYDTNFHGNDYGRAIAVDPSGNVYVTGTSWGQGHGYDYATVKYNPAGQQQWVARYQDPIRGSEAAAIAVDNSGYIYVTGTSATIRYNAAGQQEWVAPAQGNAMAIDGSGNVLVTGSTATIK